MFAPAVKTESKLRLAFTGPAGAGKTYSALAVATSLIPDGKVAVLDTEHGSAAKYADIFTFDTAMLEPPFHPDRYAEAITAAAKAGYDVLILDSMSHAWTGEGGLLDIVNNIARARYQGNTFAAWKEGTPIQNRFIEAILNAPIHVVATMRSKTEYALTKDEKTGKSKPEKIGTAPVQRDGFEYEYDVIIDMGIDNVGIVNKTRCPALAGAVIDKPGAALAATLRDWLHGAPAVARPATPPASTPQRPAQPATNGNGGDIDPLAAAIMALPHSDLAFSSAAGATRFIAALTKDAPRVDNAILEAADRAIASKADGATVKAAADAAIEWYKTAAQQQPAQADWLGGNDDTAQRAALATAQGAMN